MIGDKHNEMVVVNQTADFGTTATLVANCDDEGETIGTSVIRQTTDRMQLGSLTEENGLLFKISMNKKGTHGTLNQHTFNVLHPFEKNYPCYIQGHEGIAFRNKPDIGAGFSGNFLTKDGQFKFRNLAANVYYNWFIGSIDKNSVLQSSFHTDNDQIATDVLGYVTQGSHVQYGQMNNHVSQKVVWSAAEANSKWMLSETTVANQKDYTFCPTLQVAFNTSSKTSLFQIEDKGGVAVYITTYYVESRFPRMFE